MLTRWLLSFAIAQAVFLIYPVQSARADDFDSNGVKIHYVVRGQGDPVVLLHGLASSGFINWQLPGTVRELSRSFKVIAMDFRGHGFSGKPAEEGQYGVQMVEDVVRLMDHLQIKRAHIVGYSMGGMVAMKLLTMHPDRVETAVIGGMGLLKAGSPLDRFWAGLKPGSRGQAIPIACLHGITELGITEDQARQIQVPITIVVGEKDPCRQMYVEPLLRLRPDLPVRIVAGAGHFDCILKRDFIKDVDEALLDTQNRGEPNH